MWLSRLNSPWVLVPAVAVIVLLAWWLRTRDRRAQRALIVAVIILVVVSLVQLFRPETPAETIERKIGEMAQAVPLKHIDKIFQHVSEAFSVDGTTKAKETMRGLADRSINTGELTSVEAWKFRDAKVNRPADGPATGSIEFNVKPHGPNIPDVPYRCVAHFILDEDGQWRLVRFKLYQFGSNREVEVPFVAIP
jgi:hypothetical protein